MNNTSNTIIIGLLALIAGLLLGYFLSGNNMMYNSHMGDDSHMHTDGDDHSHGDVSALRGDMQEEMSEHMYDELVANDGELQHMMDEMLLIGRGKTGEEFEQAWLRGMIVHHMGAVAMSEKLLEQTNRAELIELGEGIITNQQAEINQMKTWLEEWYNTN